MWKFIKKQKLLVNLAAAALVYILFFWVGSSVLQSYTRHNQTISVPDLRGLPFGRVKEILSNKELEFKIADSAYNGKKPALTVLEQTPVPNAKVKQGRTIYLTVNSQAAPHIKMPDLKDASLKQAQMILETAGLNVGKLIYKPDLAQNAVLDQLCFGQHIDAGTPVKKGTTIDLVLGDGLGKSDFTVPDVVALTFSQAKFVLDASNLNLGSVVADNTVHGDTLSAIVYKQNPDINSANNKVTIGGTVDLYITMDKSLLNKQ